MSTAIQWKDMTHTAAQIDAAVDDANAHIADSGIHMTTAEKTKLAGLENYDDTDIQQGLAAETAAREAADTALQTAIDAKATLTQLLGAGTGLSSGTDLNAVKTIGRYYWGSTVAAALANSPVSTYTLLSSEPDDWASAYGSKYFEKYTEANTGKERYRFVQGETAPVFAVNTYYKCSGAGGTLTVENIQAASRVRQTFVENDTLARSGRYFVRFFASSYSGTWSSWFRFEGTEVL